MFLEEDDFYRRYNPGGDPLEGSAQGPQSPARVPTQNDPDWTPPGPDWEYRPGVGWRPKPGSPTAGAGGTPAPVSPMIQGAINIAQVGADRARGLTGGYFDDNGQWVSGEPRSGGGGGGGGAVSGPMGMPQSPSFQWPNWQSAGQFQPRDATFDYEKFSHPDYTPSSWDDVTKQPGYEDSEKRLRQQIEAGAAYKGMVRSGMAIGDLYSGLDSFRGQKFNEFDNRRFRDYSANRDNKFGAWQGNLGAEATKFGLELGADRDIYDRFATDVDRGNNFRFNTASKDFDSILSKWLKQVDSLTSIATAGNT